MPLEISNLLNDTFGWSFSSRGLNSIFSNKFYTSLILTIIILIIIMNIYPCKKGTSSCITFKLGFYILVTSLSIIFIHDAIVHGIHEKNVVSGETDVFINALGGDTNPAFSKDITPVHPYLNKKSTINDNSNSREKKNLEGKNSYKEGHEELFSQYGV
jgi:hypothetical protein